MRGRYRESMFTKFIRRFLKTYIVSEGSEALNYAEKVRKNRVRQRMVLGGKDTLSRE